MFNKTLEYLKFIDSKMTHHIIHFLFTVNYRLWNSTLVEDYPKVDQVKIGSNARIVIPPNIEIQQENLKNDQATVRIISVN